MSKEEGCPEKKQKQNKTYIYKQYLGGLIIKYSLYQLLMPLPRRSYKPSFKKEENIWYMQLQY